MNSNDNIMTSTCSVCGRKGPGTEVRDRGFICRSCDPQRFEAAARADIDAWLAGGEFGAGK